MRPPSRSSASSSATCGRRRCSSRLAQEVKRAARVDREDLLVVLVAHLDERPHGDRAGVGHDDVDAAQALRFVEQAPHLLHAACSPVARPPARSIDGAGTVAEKRRCLLSTGAAAQGVAVDGAVHGAQRVDVREQLDYNLLSLAARPGRPLLLKSASAASKHRPHAQRRAAARDELTAAGAPPRSARVRGELSQNGRSTREVTKFREVQQIVKHGIQHPSPLPAFWSGFLVAFGARCTRKRW